MRQVTVEGKKLSQKSIILDNVIFDLQKKGGISTYWLEMIKRFAASTTNLIMHGRLSSACNVQRKVNKLYPKKPFPRFLARKIDRYLPIRTTLSSPALFHSSYYRVIPQPNILNIVTVYDFMYERFRKGIPKMIHGWQKKYALGWADGIICISESTKQDLLHFLPEFVGKRIKVIPLGASGHLTVQSRNDLPHNEFSHIVSKKYVLFVGARGGYKNFRVAVDTVNGLADCRFLIVGGGALSAQESTCLNSVLPDRYWHVADVGDSLLNYFYNHAFCLMYPSLCEGFGVPLLEAMGAGCPVVGVNISSIPEVCGQAGLLVSKASASRFISKINLLNDLEFREKKIEEGLNQVQKFSWDKCFQETIEFYDEIYSEKFGSGY